MIEIKKTAEFESWLGKLKDSRVKATIASRIYRLESGLMGDVKPVGSGLSELRIHLGSGFRIYFKQVGNQIILLLCGGDKSTQQKDIEKAKKLADYWSN
jgi:putative addiction module killer protein